MRNIACAFACLACLALSGPAFAKEAPEKCLAQADKVIATLQANVESNPEFELKIFTAERAKKLIATINAFKPVTHYGGDRVIVLLKNSEEGGGAMMLFVTKDCITHPFSPVPMAAWRKTVQKAFGDAL
jgi:hypothetical protein